MAVLHEKPNRRRFLTSSGVMGLGMLAASRAIAADLPPLAPPERQPEVLVLPDEPLKKLGWAVVGLGQLSLEEIMPAFALSKRSRPTALVSGHPDKAKRVAAGYGIDPSHLYDYQNFDRLIDDRDVDIVYIVLPNSMHAEYTIRALEAGKHVLCEKPMAPTTDECEAMIAAAKKADRKLMIAYRLRYEPFHQAAIELCREERLGKIVSIIADNSQGVKPPNIRLSKTLAGGPLGDVGIYCLNAARYLTGAEPIEVWGMERRPQDDPRFREVAAGVSFGLRFPDGATAQCGCAFDASEHRLLRVVATKGVLEMDQAFSYRGQELRLRTDKGVQTLKIVSKNHFALEMDHFSECIADSKSPRTPGEEGLRDMEIIQAIETAAKTGQIQKLKPV